MVKDALDARDTVYGLLLEGDVDTALAVAQTLTVLGSDKEFECVMRNLLSAGTDNVLELGGADFGWEVEVQPLRLTAGQQTTVCNAVVELRESRRFNTAVLAVPAV